jgi:hypothetical protein
MKHIGVPRITDLDEHMDADEIRMVEEVCDDIDLSAPFADCTDPFTGEGFIASVERMRSELTEGVQPSTDAADYMGEEETAANGESGTLDAFSADDGLPNYEDLTPTEQLVYERIDADASFPADMEVEVPHLIGAIPFGQSVAEASTHDTILDPTDDHWDRADRPEDWVTTTGDTERELDEAWKGLERKAVVAYTPAVGDEDEIGLDVTELDVDSS